jgi:predicted FMN-binding regulatory protein PaiB
VPKIQSDRGVKAASQRRLIKSVDPQWLPKHDALSQAYVDKMLDGIVNFSIPVARFETRWKLSQNRGRREMERIAAELAKSRESAERALAELTLRHLVEK